MITEIMRDGTIELRSLSQTQAFQIQTAMRRLSKLNSVETPEGKRCNETILSQLDDVLDHYNKMVQRGIITARL